MNYHYKEVCQSVLRFHCQTAWKHLYFKISLSFRSESERIFNYSTFVSWKFHKMVIFEKTAKVLSLGCTTEPLKWKMLSKNVIILLKAHVIEQINWGCRYKFVYLYVCNLMLKTAHFIKNQKMVTTFQNLQLKFFF